MTEKFLTAPARHLSWIGPVFILFGASACCSIVLWQLLWNGPFRWHISLPQFWQGGIEALVLIGTLAALQFWRRRGWRLALSSLLGMLYLRRHAVDAALFVDLFYFEIIIALGAGIVRWCGSGKTADLVGYLRAFVLGLCMWSVCAWTISAFDYGSVANLRALTVVLIIPAITARSVPACLFVERRMTALSAADRAAIAALVAWILILFAHSATALGFDSTWYGLRGERVLVGGGSAFTSQGLVMPVYYFPKVYELFLIPVSGLGSTSVISGVSIGSLCLLAAACYALLRQLGIGPALVRLAGVSLVVTLPAVANYSLEIKPDVLSAFLLVFAWLHVSDFVRTRNPSTLLWLLALLALSIQAKLTAIPFVAALVVATGIATFRTRPAERPLLQAGEVPTALITVTMSLIVSAFATARTLLLAGVPTVAPDPLLRLWHALGFKLTFPVGVVQWQYPKDWADLPALAFDLLFRPQLMIKIIVTWTGNVWLWLGIIALVAGLLLPRPKADQANATAASTPGIGLILTAFILMLCWGYDFRGGDGNYFIAGIVPAILLGTAATWRRLYALPALRNAFLLAICGFALFQASYSFLSASWSPGTRGFDLDFTRGARNLRDRDLKDFTERGIARIAAHLRSLKHTARVIGCTPPDDGLGFHLPASYEGFGQLIVPRWDFFNTADNFLAFLKADHIDYLVVPLASNSKENCNGLTVLAEAVAALEKNPHVAALRDDGYVMYDLSGLY